MHTPSPPHRPCAPHVTPAIHSNLHSSPYRPVSHDRHSEPAKPSKQPHCPSPMQAPFMLQVCFSSQEVSTPVPATPEPETEPEPEPEPDACNESPRLFQFCTVLVSTPEPETKLELEPDASRNLLCIRLRLKAPRKRLNVRMTCDTRPVDRTQAML